jgi:hypothetical protein
MMQIFHISATFPPWKCCGNDVHISHIRTADILRIWWIAPSATICSYYNQCVADACKLSDMQLSFLNTFLVLPCLDVTFLEGMFKMEMVHLFAGSSLLIHSYLFQDDYMQRTWLCILLGIPTIHLQFCSSIISESIPTVWIRCRPTCNMCIHCSERQ